MNFHDLFTEARRLNVVLTLDNETIATPPSLSNEALFHLPLLAMLILVMAKSNRKPRVAELGQMVGECLQRSLSGFKGSSQRMGWSANLRVRTVKALTFLEVAELASVDQFSKTISVTEKGRKVVTAALGGTSSLSIALQTMDRAYRDIYSERQIELRLN